MNNLLMYNIPPEKSRKIKAIALQLGFRIRVVKPEEQGLAVGCLAGLILSAVGEMCSQP